MTSSLYSVSQTLTSTLFRLFAWAFLRIIPSPYLLRLIPSLYALFVTSWLLSLFRNIRQNESEGSSSKSNRSCLKILLFSLPTSSTILHIFILIINSVLLAGVYDITTISTRDPASSVIFTRVGAISPREAKVVVRYPEIGDEILRVVWRQINLISDADVTSERVWNPGPLIALHSDKDWVGVARLTGLWPSTNYEYHLAFENSTILSYPENPIRFRTFPDPDLPTGTRFKFMASSCILPNFPYLPFRHGHIRGFDLLSRYIAANEHEVLSMTNKMPMMSSGSNSNVQVTVNNTDIPSSIEFMLLLGDFIYADVPQYAGSDLESYLRLYRRMYSSPSFRKVYERLPIFNIFDDHEFYNNFAGKSNASIWPLPNASIAYTLYNGEANHDPMMEHSHFYNFRYGDVVFFVLDTRLYRSSPNAEGDSKTMLGDQQLGALREWLQQVNSTATFKFIISSVPFTSLWSFDAEDTWAGFITERNDLLSIISSVPNVFIISGDRHEFAAIEYTDSKVVEFSTSPLSAFYIPIVRSLRKRSGSKRSVETHARGEGTVVVDDDAPRETVLKYLPLGNHKWSTFEIDTTDHQAPKLNVETVIDGRPEWRHSILGQPVNMKASTAVASQITRGLRDALEKIGLSPTKWF